jgi:hypothetical protein
MQLGGPLRAILPAELTLLPLKSRQFLLCHFKEPVAPAYMKLRAFRHDPLPTWRGTPNRDKAGNREKVLCFNITDL